MSRVRVFFRRGAWWLDYRPEGDNGPRCRRKVGPDKKLARLAAAKIEVQIAEGRYLDKRKVSKTSFRAASEQYLRWSKGTKRSWKRDRISLRALATTFGGTLLGQITTKQVEQYKIRRAGEVSPQTVNHELQCLRHLFTKAIEWGDADSNPALPVKKLPARNERLRYLSDDEEARLLAECSNHLRPIVTVALYTGMRESEVLGLRWADVDLENGIIHLEDTKNGRRRDVPMPRVARRTLADHPRHIRSPYVFTKVSGDPFGRVDKGMRGACERAEIQDVVFHTLRHTYASRLVMAGVDLLTVKELLGHPSWQW